MGRDSTGLLVGIALGGAVLLLARPRSRERRPRVDPPSGGAPSGGWADGSAPARIRDLAGSIEHVSGWPGLGDFLVAKAWTESRGNPRAGSGASNNEARGWFGMRPKSGLAHSLSHYSASHPNLLKDERWAVALAAWYAYRLRPYAAAGQGIDWLAIARGWAYPSLVDDIEAQQQRSKDVARRFGQAVRKAGLDPDHFPHRPAFPGGFSWPGLASVLKAVGARHPDEVHIGGVGRGGRCRASCIG